MISKEELQGFEDVFSEREDRSLSERAKRMADVLLGLWERLAYNAGSIIAGAAMLQTKTAENLLLNNTVIEPRFWKEEAGDLFLLANYFPEGKTFKAKADDLARAARVLKSQQHILVRPRGTFFEEKYALATVNSHKLADDRIVFTFGLEKSTSEAKWGAQPWEQLVKEEWVFKAPKPQVLQSHFFKLLRQGALSDVLQQNRSAAAILRVTLLGISQVRYWRI